MFSGSKDTDRQILLHLESDRELLKSCTINKYFYTLCDEAFFRNRIFYKYPSTLNNKPKGMKWKQYYLRIVYLKAKMLEDYNFNFISGDPEKYYKILKLKKDYKQFYEASKYNYQDLLSFLILKEPLQTKNIEWGVYGAAEGGHREIIDYYLRYDSNLTNIIFSGAALGGNEKLVKEFIDKGADDWGEGMYNAAQGGHRDLVDFFISKGANDWNWGMKCAAEGGHRDLVELFISKGANDWNKGMYGAAEGGHRDLVEFFINKGADDWNGGMKSATQGGHRDLVEFFISKGANNWNWGMYAATEGEYDDLIKIFKEKMLP